MLLIAVAIWLCVVNASNGNSIFHQWHAMSSRMRDYEYDLLRATSKSEQNYVAFGAETDAITRTPSTNLPSTLTEMAIVASVRTPFSGGYLFSIVKPLDSVISLGVSMYPLRRNTYNISLIYTNTNLFVKSQNVATFQFTYARSIIDVALKVSGHQITLFVGCYELKTIPRDPVDTIIDRDSKFYVASAGAKQKNGFKGNLDSLMLYGDPEASRKICYENANEEPVFLTETRTTTTTELAPTQTSTTARSIIYTTQEMEEHNTILDYTIPSTTRSNLFIKMIALNEPMNGNMHGIRGADYACYRQAARAGLPGVYKAFLNSRTQRLQSLLQSSFGELPVANIRGEILFNTWNGIFDNHGEMSYQSSRILSFSGRDIVTDRTWPQKYVWHGVNINGEKMSEDLCGSWETDSAGKYGVASNLLNKRLLGYDRLSCDNQFIVLCIETSPFKPMV